MENRTPDAPGNEVGPPLPADGEVQRVEIERIGEASQPSGPFQGSQGGFDLGGGRFKFVRFSTGATSDLKPPILATWVCLAIAWVFLGSEVPFTIFLGIPFNMAALLLAAACLARGGLLTGLFVFGLGTIGSFIVYLIGLFRFLV